MAGFRAAKIADIRQQVGAARVICGLSGGVDSAVAAVLIHEAIGDQLTCVFVDHGLMRRSEEHTSELQSLMRISYAVFCLKKNNKTTHVRIPSITVQQST